MDIPLSRIQTALVTSRLELDNRVRLDVERFERHVERRRARFERERANSKAAMFRALAESMGSPPFPEGATLGIRADGTGVLTIPTPPAAPPPPPADGRDHHDGEDAHGSVGGKGGVIFAPDADLAPIHSMPAANGALAGAPTP